MRKSKPIDLEVSVCDTIFLQSMINDIFLKTLKYKLDNSNASYKEKLSYIDSIIKSLKSG